MLLFLHSLNAFAETVTKTFITKANKFISEKNYDKARRILKEAVKNIPANWKFVQETPDGKNIYFWSQLEFFTYIGFIKSEKPSDEKNITWMSGSYPPSLLSPRTT